MSEYTGKVVSVDTKLGKGNIGPAPEGSYPKDFDVDEDLYFLVSDAYDKIQVGDRVSYSLEKGGIGYQAKNVKKA
ncbi:hypothetical protein [Pseudomonas sp. KNUC1026]|uniref:hypothetical protein n=1 Tax=Pseudomonas sp. KNUC1026 TaxID=2893890 RepID=UPI001F46B8E8|nr:hypothetical protein [Pseudomonas sp. KNUC1026]UFH51557.1 hypothetical protein LN139_11695 [Pseudomonas sp. KNUC1026]